MQARFTWNLMARAQRVLLKRQPSRSRRVLVAMFRWGRNVAAMLGVCFAYLLIIGYFQYMDQVAQNDVLCSVSRCM
ncbi:hypothetical protein [Burkholderia gladioli]|uniref:hypothetical protein n=1 Tax=Burkholderia gladioli TaxID=28095 RepID=UPI00163EB166|nr:hypothetical protein [Burkholderia gladioli]